MLKPLLEKFKETRTVAETEVAGDFRTRPGHEMRRRQAQAELPKLEREFGDAFHKVGFPVFVAGEGVAEFTKMAQEEAEVVVVDYKKATNAVYENTRLSIGKSREFTPGVFTVMLREIRQLGADLGLTSIAAPNFDGVEYLADDAAVDALVSGYLQRYFGADLIAPALEKEAVREAMNLPGESPVVPVLFTGVPDSLKDQVGPRIFGGRYTTASIDKDPTPETVVTVFNDIKASLKS